MLVDRASTAADEGYDFENIPVFEKGIVEIPMRNDLTIPLDGDILTGQPEVIQQLTDIQTVWIFPAFVVDRQFHANIIVPGSTLRKIAFNR